MPTPRTPNQKKQYAALNARLAKYTKLIEQIYAKYNSEAASIALRTDYLPNDGKMFRFQDYPQTRAAINDLLATYANELLGVINRGTSTEWQRSNTFQDLLANKVLRGYGISDPKAKEYKHYFQANSDQLKAFQQRQISGMNLSQRVWNLRGQYKEELEMAMSVGIEQGISANALASKMKQYLNDPDKLFRRVRDEFGNLQLSKNAKAYHPGRGVYRSSFKNAQRLTRSEINMAYRTAEQERWRQFDFVVGYEIKLSQSHPCHDVCDELAGRYPKDFVWTGWHPNDMCYAVSILKTDDEFWRDLEKDDDEPNEPSVNEVTDLPDGFKDWIADNADRIEAAEKRGTQPYFIRDNREAVDEVLKPREGNEISDYVFLPAQNISEVQERIKATGIRNIELGDISLEHANWLLEGIENESRNLGGLDINKLIVTDIRKERLNGHWVNVGGTYNSSTNVLSINTISFKENIYNEPLSWEERISRCENFIEKKRAEIAQYESYLGKGKSKKFETEIKGYIKDAKWAIDDKERDILRYQEMIKNGVPAHSWTVASEFESIREQVFAQLHHEFGHYLHSHLLDDVIFRSKGMFAPSDYAEKTDHELFAEWYSRYRMKGADGVPQELLSLFKKFEPNSNKKLKVALDLQIAELMQKARNVGTEIQTIAENIAHRHGAVVTPINFKSRESIHRKVLSERQNPKTPDFRPLDLKDAVRNTIVAPRESINNIITELKSSSMFYRGKEQKTELGYVGNIINMRTRQGIIGEIQVNTPAMIYAKEPPEVAINIIGKETWGRINRQTKVAGGLGHKYYEEWRVMTEKEKQSERGQRLLRKSLEYYAIFAKL